MHNLEAMYLKEIISVSSMTKLLPTNRINMTGVCQKRTARVAQAPYLLRGIWGF